jgi:hypothetical protein
VAERRRLLVVLDEFSYLVDGDRSIPSVIQRFWDAEGRQSRLRLVLCGSATSILEGLGAERAPLFGRFTARLQVHPFGYRQAALFHSSLDAADKIRAYAIVGGMPLYLRMWEPGQSLEPNLLRLIGTPAAPLLNEGELLLRTELPEAAGYFRIMAAVASGRTTFSEIKDAAGLDPTRALDRLVAVRLLERRAPMTADLDRTRARTYRIVDNFLAFWFRFVYPNRGEIERGLGSEVVRRLIVPRLDEHVGPVFEEICRDYVRIQAAAGRFEGITRVGSWWTKDGQAEIDVVAMSGRDVVLAGEAKWARTVDRRVLAHLAANAERLPRRSADMRFALFARAGFRGVEMDEAHLVTAEGLYGTPGTLGTVRAKGSAS